MENFRVNDFYVRILGFNDRKKAEHGVNMFIEECNADGDKILEMTSHFASVDEDTVSYTFIFKIEPYQD